MYFCSYSIPAWPARPLAAAALLCGVAGSAGCLAQAPCAPSQRQIVVYHAGSLSASFKAVEALFERQTGVCVVDVAGGSVDAARQVTAGGKPCDVYASADAEDIDVLLKPARRADFTIRFAQGEMVLAYSTGSRGADAIVGGSPALRAADDVPEVAPGWFETLTAPGVVIGGSHPFLDPGGYRADLVFQVARDRYALPGLYNSLLTHYAITHPGDVLGKSFDYQFTYAHSARAAAKNDATGTYRYAKLPPDLALARDAAPRVGITIPGLGLPGSAATARIPATRVTWGVTILRTAPNPDDAARFLAVLLGPEGVAAQRETGPQPIVPAIVTPRDRLRVPRALRGLVATAAQ